MKRAERLKLWRRGKVSYAAAGLRAGFSKQAIREAVLGLTKKPRLEIARVVAQVCGRSIGEVFPAWRGDPALREEPVDVAA